MSGAPGAVRVKANASDFRHARQAAGDDRYWSPQEESVASGPAIRNALRGRSDRGCAPCTVKRRRQASAVLWFCPARSERAGGADRADTNSSAFDDVD